MKLNNIKIALLIITSVIIEIIIVFTFFFKNNPVERYTNGLYVECDIQDTLMPGIYAIRYDYKTKESKIDTLMLYDDKE